MVVMGTMFSNVESEAQRVEVNCVPLSEVRWAGTPKRATQVVQKAAATSEAAMVERGAASSQREVWSAMVSR